MSRAFRIGIALLLGLLAQARLAWADNPFGVMLWPTGNQDLALLAARAKGLGVGWLRPPAVFIDRWQNGGPCLACAQTARAGLDVALTVRNGGRDYAPRQPSTAPDDVGRYKQTLAAILDAWRPRLLVVENEEDNPQSFQAGATLAGTIGAYGVELKAACAVAHQRGITCANGGLSGDLAAVLTWLSFLQRETPDAACNFAKRAFYRADASPNAAELCRIHAADQVPEALRNGPLHDAQALVALYRSAPIDMVNLHWYGRDAGVFATVVQTLSREAGKPVMSNEIGQWRWEADPVYVRPLLRAAFATGVNPAIWFSIDTPSTASLFNEDGSLRQTGQEFAHQMSGRK